MDAASLAVLQDLYLREGRSLLLYLNEAVPWTAPEHRPLLDLVAALAREEEKRLGDVVRFLVRRHVMPPPLGVYPEPYTDLNFLAIDRLLSVLIDDQKARVRHLEATVPLLPDDTARDLVRSFLEMKLRHVLKLDEARAGWVPAPSPAPQSLSNTA